MGHGCRPCGTRSRSGRKYRVHCRTWITIDARQLRLRNISDAEPSPRKVDDSADTALYPRAFAKFAFNASSKSKGAVLDDLKALDGDGGRQHR
jgi:hypothetical protein